MADQRLIKELKYKHNHLEKHWSTAGVIGLDPNQSDRSYKLHLGRMMDLYANHKMSVNNKKPMPSGKKPSPLNMLYGMHGIKSATGHPSAERKMREKEKNYNNRVTRMENLERNRPVNLRPQSAPATDYDPSATMPQPVPRKKKRQYRRCLDESMSEDDVVLRGLYRLDDRQAKIYEDFARMLAGFDHYDSVNILADVLTDSVNVSGLQDFTGADLEDDV